MKQRFKDINFKPAALDIITKANTIIAKYVAAGYTMTLRQLYYQFVTRNWITNEEKSYKRLASIISDGRLAGLIDWDAIEDRGRQPAIPLEFRDLRHRVDSALANYRRDRWAEQPYYVELWVEKQALAGVLQPIAHRHHITLMVNKGYSSQSAMKDAADRFKVGMDRTTEGGLLLYLGDHDPSGEDMVRDIRDRFYMFRATGVEVRKVALTMAQIREYDPPPNPAKVSDPRAAKYIEEHGDESWEVDALPPEVLNRLLDDAIEEVVDRDRLDAVLEREETDKKLLRTAVESL
jgi:hypothetical protein